MSTCLVCGDPATSGLLLDAPSRAENGAPRPEQTQPLPGHHPNAPSRQEAP